MADDVTIERHELDTPRGPMLTGVAVPAGDGPWPGVLIVHDALGVTTDLRHQAEWLAGAGFLAVAPDLYHAGGRRRCLFPTMRQAMDPTSELYRDLELARTWLADRDDCTGRIGVIGFCLGGGIALVLAGEPGYAAASANYGGLPADAEQVLGRACPVIGSYGAQDPTLREAPEQLRRILADAGVDHEVDVYPEAGHSFLNDHDPAEVPRWAVVVGAMSRSAHHEPSARQARRRIEAFLDRHLRDPVGAS